MEEIDPPPYRNHRDERTINKVTKALVKRNAPPFGAAHFTGLAFTSGVYSLGDDLNILRGALFSANKLEREIYEADLRRSVRQVNVPVYFMEGRYDTVLSPEVAAAYLRALSTPAGKHLIWFERSEHWPHIEERKKFHATMREILTATPRAAQGAARQFTSFSSCSRCCPWLRLADRSCADGLRVFGRYLCLGYFP